MEKKASAEQLWLGQAESQRQENAVESNLLDPILQENGDCYYIYESQSQESKGIYKGVRRDSAGSFFEQYFQMEQGNTYYIDEKRGVCPFIRLHPEQYTTHSQPINYASCLSDSEKIDSEAIRLSAIGNPKEVLYYVQKMSAHNKLGAGGNGNIYAGLRVVGNKIHRIAVKILLNFSLDESHFNDLHKKEFEFIEKYQYSQAYCMGNFGEDHKFIAMDELKGPIFENVTSTSLHPDLTSPGVTKRDLWEAFTPSIAFLGLMHSENLVHRDLKSGNFMFRWVKEHLQFIMIDFGATKKRTRKGQVDDSQHLGSPGMFFDQTPVSDWGKRHDVTHFMLIMAAVLSGSPAHTFNYSPGLRHPDIQPDFSRIDLGLQEDLDEISRERMRVISGLNFNELIINFFLRSLPSPVVGRDLKEEENSPLYENDIKKVSNKGRLKIEELKSFFDIVKEVFKLMDQLKSFDHEVIAKLGDQSCKNEGERQALLKSNHKANTENTRNQYILIVNIAKLIIHSEGKWYKTVDKRLKRGLNPDVSTRFKDFKFDVDSSLTIIGNYLPSKISRPDTYDSSSSVGLSSIDSFLSGVSEELMVSYSVQGESCITRLTTCCGMLILILSVAMFIIYLMEQDKPVPVFYFDQLNFNMIGKEVLNQTITWHLQALLTSMHFQKGRLFFDGVGVNLTQGIVSNFSVPCGSNASYLPENQYLTVNGQNVTDIKVVRSWGDPLDCNPATTTTSTTPTTTPTTTTTTTPTTTTTTTTSTTTSTTTTPTTPTTTTTSTTTSTTPEPHLSVNLGSMVFTGNGDFDMPISAWTSSSNPPLDEMVHFIGVSDNGLVTGVDQSLSWRQILSGQSFLPSHCYLIGDSQIAFNPIDGVSISPNPYSVRCANNDFKAHDVVSEVDNLNNDSNTGVATPIAVAGVAGGLFIAAMALQRLARWFSAPDHQEIEEKGEDTHSLGGGLHV